MDKSASVQQAYVSSHVFTDDGTFPNNAGLPLLVYKGAFLLHPADEPNLIRNIFASHQWTNSWEGSILTEHHYHSNTHEVLGVFCGRGDVQLGGPEGVVVELSRGDVIVIPAGVAHRLIEGSADFSCVGAYPGGAAYNMNFGKAGERPRTDQEIAAVPLPEFDPVYGEKGSVHDCWISAGA